MKLKCHDGIVRKFKVPHEEYEAYCLNCGEKFGCHDTKLLIPKFKEHSCPCTITKPISNKGIKCPTK